MLISGKGSRMVFSHDGLRDSLTRVAAPPLFYESLKREISLSERNQSTITAMTFKLESKQTIDDYALLAFIEITKLFLSVDDLIVRMGENTFIVLILGETRIAKEITSRVSSEWNTKGTPEISMFFASVCHRRGEISLDFLNRLDRQKLEICRT